MPDVPGLLNQLCSAVGLGPRARRRLEALIEERVGMAIDDFRLVQMIEFAAGARLLVVHDRDDRQTPYENRRLPGARNGRERHCSQLRALITAGF
jgi:hypothetical protein